MREAMRKWIIGLKRRPHTIPLLLLLLCCIFYTFQLTAHSNASMYVSSRIIALYVFIITLCSMLTIFSFLNAFSKGAKKRKGLMLGVVFLLIGVQVVLDWTYLQIMTYETILRENPVPITPDIATSMNWTYIHLGALVFTTLVILFMPIYHKLILKIDTTVEDEELNAALRGAENLIVEDEV